MESTIAIITLGIFVIILLIRLKHNDSTHYKTMYYKKSKMYNELQKMYEESMELNFKLSRKILELTKNKENPEE